MCGDYISLHLAFDKEQPSLKVIANLSFEGEGCAILKASSSMMTELLKGKNINEVSHLFKEFKKILFNEIEFSDKLGEINIFAGLAKFPSRIQCALLSWDTLIKGLEKPC